MAKRKKAAAPTAAESLAEFERSLGPALDKALKDPESVEGMHETIGNPITLGPRIPEAADMASKMVTNAAAASSRWLANVQTPKKDPKAEALKANTKYKNQMQKVISEDRFAKGVQAIDLDEMYATIVARGAGAFSSGVEARRAKITRVMGELRPLMVTLAQKLDAMPVDTPEQREAKMLAAKRGMEEIGRRRRGETR